MTETVHALAQALADEFAAVHGAACPADEGEYRRLVAAQEQSALCLSGGGIRSAAFSLGVVQALARLGLLAQFDYLSTVSGGGFIGGWLSALIVQQGGPAEAASLLKHSEAAPAVSALREYTSYLTPKRGLMSADTWSGIVLYLRNVLINWFAFGPVFLLAVLGAIFYRTLLWTIGGNTWSVIAAAAIASAGLLTATWSASLELPSHRPMTGPPEARVVAFLPVGAIERWIVIPMLVWACFVPMTLAGWLSAPTAGGVIAQGWLPALYALVMLLGYWSAAAAKRAFSLYVRNFGSWLLATLPSALLVWAGMRLARTVPLVDRAEALAVAGPLWLILANVLQSTAFVALRQEARLGDLDREWLARLSALKLRIAVIWALFAFCCLSLQRFAFHAEAVWPFWATPLLTLLSGPTAAWLGKQPEAGAKALGALPGVADKLSGMVLPALSAVFAVGLFTFLGYAMGELLGLLQSPLPQPTPQALLLAVQIALALVLGGLIWYAARQINVNRFSMHGVYRNRITRAFLGAARATRRPDPFTGFDPEDNPRMVSLRGEAPRKLFPVINVALNLTAGNRNAWAERKAAAFTISPLACGSAELDLPPGAGAADQGCYVPAGRYAGQERETGRRNEPAGMSLATAMTISGAAMSPNWGYHSSPVIAFLMTLFNVRLGVWLANPSVVTDPAQLVMAWPRDALLPMLGDLLGTTSDRTSAIYLSDGGHFDNLGLYEMLRRRCRLILAVDAGQDFACDFTDLGSSLRKAAIDQQIHIEFKDPRIYPRGCTEPDALDFAVATITYPEGTKGKLLYVKPCFLDDVPADVRAYGATHPQFPHESTLDQWFTESQFESYRHLGAHEMAKVAGLVQAGRSGLRALFDAAEVEQFGLSAVLDDPPEATA